MSLYLLLLMDSAHVSRSAQEYKIPIQKRYCSVSDVILRLVVQ